LKEAMTTAIPTAHHIKGIRPSLDKMSELGFDPEQCLKGTGILHSELENPKASITLQQELAFNHNLFNVSKDPCIGLRLGEAYPPQAYGILGYAMISAPSLRHGLSITASYGNLTFTLSELENRIDGNTVHFSLRPKLELEPELLQIYSDRDTSAAWCAFNEILGETIPFTKVLLGHNNPHLKQRYEDYFHCPVEFIEGHSEIQFSTDVLDKPLPQRNIETSNFCLQQCQMLIAKLSSQSSFIDDVRQMILARPGYFPDIDYLAEKLDTSTRTLRRRLKEEGSSYQELLNEIRYNLAKEYLSTTMITLEEIAELLGYSDPGNFSHAFKRWSGVSPRQWRSEQ
jgi:AraC-like DNA-binding protein